MEKKRVSASLEKPVFSSLGFVLSVLAWFYRQWVSQNSEKQQKSIVTAADTGVGDDACDQPASSGCPHARRPRVGRGDSRGQRRSALQCCAVCARGPAGEGPLTQAVGRESLAATRRGFLSCPALARIPPREVVPPPPPPTLPFPGPARPCRAAPPRAAGEGAGSPAGSPREGAYVSMPQILSKY